MNKDSGSSNRIFNLSFNLLKKGHEVHIIIPGLKDEEFGTDGLIVHRIKGLLPKPVLDLISSFLGVAKSTTFNFYDPLFILKTRKILSQSQIIQLEEPWSGSLLIPFIRFILRKPVVLDSHDVFQSMRLSNVNLIRKFVETLFEKLGYRFASLVLVVSKIEKKLLIEEGINGDKIYVIPNGVDINTFSRSYEDRHNQLEISHGLVNVNKVIFVGNMEYRPNQEAAEIITSKIAPKVEEILGNTKFILVGKCPNSLRKNSDNVLFTGVVESVADYLNISDVAIAPLLNGSGTRLKILEYFACELPVLSTNIGVEGLFTENNKNLIVGDIDQFAYNIKMLLTDKSKSKWLGANGRDFVVNNYSWTEICEKLNDIYRIKLKYK